MKMKNCCVILEGNTSAAVDAAKEYYNFLISYEENYLPYIPLQNLHDNYRSIIERSLLRYDNYPKICPEEFSKEYRKKLYQKFYKSFHHYAILNKAKDTDR